MKIEYYKNKDYSDLVVLYRACDEFEFDEVTDSQESIRRKIDRDPESILLAYEEEELVGSVSIIEDGRIAILFRLVTGETGGDHKIAKELVLHAGKILSKRGYTEVHITGPTENKTAKEIRESSGFRKGKRYDWFWKKISS